jgi:hypothetical protein
MRETACVLILTLLGCASSAPPPAPPVETATVEPPSRPITIVDAPPPVIAERPEPTPAESPALARLRADSDSLRQDAKDIAKNEPPEVRVLAAEKLVVIAKQVDDSDERSASVYDAMAEIGGDALADFLFAEAERESLATGRRRAAFVAAESAQPGDETRAQRRSKIAADLIAVAAKEPKNKDGTAEAAAVATRLTPGFRRCYDKSRAVEPNLEATFVLNLNVDARGAVTRSKAEATPAKELARCVEAIGKNVLFAPLASGPTSVGIPIAFGPKLIRTL